MRSQLTRAIATSIVVCALRVATGCGGDEPDQDDQIVEQDNHDDEEQEDEGEDQGRQGARWGGDDQDD